MLNSIYEGIISGNAKGVAESVQQALAAGIDPGEILNRGMIAAMTDVGSRFEAGEMYVPEVLIAARAMKQGMEILKPRLLEANIEPVGKVVLATVQGDLHDIGKNLVAMMLEGTGFEVIDLGIDVKPEGFVAAVQEHRPDFIGMSALLTTTMPNMRATIEVLKSAGLRDQVKVMVGGAPVTQAFADEIGADLYAPDAAAAASRAKAMLA